MSKTFHIGDLISITDGHLVSPTHMDGIYEILNYMTGDSLMTHQLGSACEAVAEAVYTQHPWLRDVVIDDGQITSQEDVDEFLIDVGFVYGEFHELEPAPELWGNHNPIEDLLNMLDPAKVVVVDPENPDSIQEAVDIITQNEEKEN